MDMEDDDDLYDPEPAVTPDAARPTTETETAGQGQQANQQQAGSAQLSDEDGDDDSDIDIITEREDGSKPTPPIQSRYSDIRNIPQRSTADTTKASTAAVEEGTSQGPRLAVPSADKEAEAASSSQIDISANPMYPAVGKPITQINIDEDLADHEKPWRQPGTDLSDYFNYGFDEFTWALYAAKQESLRNEYSADAIAAHNKKLMDDMNAMMMGGMSGMPGMAGAPTGPGGSAMPGMDGMPAETQQMLQQMLANGLDPNQMDPNAMAAMFGGGMGDPSGSVAGSQAFPNARGANTSAGSNGFAGNQGDYGGYNQGMTGRGGFGRGRGMRRW